MSMKNSTTHMQTMDRRDAIKKSGLLVGIAMSAGSLTLLMQSCQSQDRLSWEPKFLNEQEALTVSAMLDRMLPQTETPGATELKVDLFVDLMFADSLSPEDQTHCRNGLTDFMEHCRNEFNRPFHRLTSAQQDGALRALGERTNQFNPSIWGSTLGVQPPIDFYRRLRQFALLGYFTSEEVGKNVLAYDPIPGQYQGCTDLAKGQKIWSL